MNLINGIINFLSKLEWGTVADWVSGIGSFGAVIVALWQIIMQRKKEEKDKILANRPFFSFIEKSYLEKKKDHLWVIAGEDFFKKLNDYFYKSNKNYSSFKNDISAYEFKNVSQAVATNVVLKVEYQNEAKDKVLKTDYCNIGTCVIGNERAIILPHSIVNDPSNYAYSPKKVYLYFTTIDDRAYCQRWIEKKDKSDFLCIELVDIKEVSIEEIPSEGGCICLDVT